MSFKITENVTWVGKVDWDLTKFHGEEYSTHKGSTYNAYLVRDEKNVLIDTVWLPYTEEFVDNLQKEIALAEIDYIIINHGEVDHSGALTKLMELIPDTPIYCTANAVKSLKGQYHKEWNFHVVKTGDKLNIGSKEFIFVEAPMMHWPDTMMCYLTGENILFSNDAFGQHYASEYMFNDLVDQAELYRETLKYYANILTPFNRQVERKLKELAELNLTIDIICPSHGVVWRDNPMQIVNKYTEWVKDYQENQITIIYDTMWDGTRKLAEAIAEGIKQADPAVNIKLYNTGRKDKNDILTEIFQSKAILVGSPTVNNGVLSSIAGIMEEIRGLQFKNKKAAAFGTYGWSEKSVKMIGQLLNDAGFEVVNDGYKVSWNPDEVTLDGAVEFGKSFVKTLG
ncbi:MAG: beta-lactamase domain protein [Massilibacillus sp.]|jgi:flavorubredoxin|nr:beta-lactamase domain protein [Massilibacillus sp.]